jgi:hypothetical protein
MIDRNNLVLLDSIQAEYRTELGKFVDAFNALVQSYVQLNFATQAQVDAGTSATLVISPATLAAHLDDRRFSATQESAGAADGQKAPRLNPFGLLAASFIPRATDAQMAQGLSDGVLVTARAAAVSTALRIAAALDAIIADGPTSNGPADAGKAPVLNAQGRLDASFIDAHQSLFIGTFDATLAGGGLSPPVVNGTTARNAGDYTVVKTAGTYSFPFGVPDPFGTPLQPLDVIYYDGQVWQPISNPMSIESFVQRDGSTPMTGNLTFAAVAGRKAQAFAAGRSLGLKNSVFDMLENTLRILTFTTALTRPTGRDRGEIYFNFADRQIGVVDENGNAIDVTSTAAVGPTAPESPVVGQLWFNTTPPAQMFVWATDGTANGWRAVGSGGGGGGGDFLPLAGGTLTGPLTLNANTLQALILRGRASDQLSQIDFRTNDNAQAEAWTFRAVPTGSPVFMQWRHNDAPRMTLFGAQDPTLGGRLQVFGPAFVAASTVDQPGIRIPQGVAPAAPANGDIWTTSAGVFARIAGVTVNLAGGAATAVGPTAPASPVNGQLWYRTAAPVGLFVWFNDGDSSQWVQTAGGVGSVSASTAALSQAQSEITKLQADVAKMKAVDAEKNLLIKNLNLKVAELKVEEQETESAVKALLHRVEALEAKP